MENKLLTLTNDKELRITSVELVDIINDFRKLESDKIGKELLLKLEYDYEKETFRQQTEAMGIGRKVKRGLNGRVLLSWDTDGIPYTFVIMDFP